MAKNRACGATGGQHVCELPAAHRGLHRRAITSVSSTSWTFDDRPEPEAVDREPQLALFSPPAAHPETQEGEQPNE